MASLTLERYESDGDLLPPICCRCGDTSTGLSTLKLIYTPPWIFLFIFLCLPVYFILAVMLTRRANFQLPTCDRHYYLGFWRKSLAIGSVAMIIFCVIWLGFTIDTSSSATASSWKAIDRSAQVAGMIVGTIILVVSMSFGVRPNRITAHAVTLKGLSPKFVLAVEQFRILMEEFSE